MEKVDLKYAFGSNGFCSKPPPCFNISSPWRKVEVHKAEPSKARLDFVELVFKDDFISRADMW